MRFSSETIVFQEVPGEVTLAYNITGCPVGCRGCHSADTWPASRGELLTMTHFVTQLDRYQNVITAVLFLGGEWYPRQLIECLRCARARGLRTCLYTGLNRIPAAIIAHLTYLKVGPWRADLGGLESPRTNQRFYDVRTGTVLNAWFCPDFIATEREQQHVALIDRSN